MKFLPRLAPMQSMGARRGRLQLPESHKRLETPNKHFQEEARNEILRGV
ncbi:hypothetical protein RintRC_3935 [Richelia intracellularis]|nr:hypothetical protein RintRC_3935 [Richelia intracellularis]